MEAFAERVVKPSSSVSNVFIIIVVNLLLCIAKRSLGLKASNNGQVIVFPICSLHEFRTVFQQGDTEAL